MRLQTLLTSLNIVAAATAAKLTVFVAPSPPSLPNPAALPPSTHATLIGPPGIKYDAALRTDGSLIFEDLSQASYLLTIHARDHTFPPLRVDVSKGNNDNPQDTISAWQTFRGNEWSNKGPQFGSAKDELNIQVRPVSQKNFYQQRGGFNILGFLKSPMILMALVSVVMIFGMPYLLDNMDPETKAEFEEMQKSGPLSGSQGAASQIQNFDLAGFLSGRGGAVPEAEAEVPKKKNR